MNYPLAADKCIMLDINLVSSGTQLALALPHEP